MTFQIVWGNLAGFQLYSERPDQMLCELCEDKEIKAETGVSRSIDFRLHILWHFFFKSCNL